MLDMDSRFETWNPPTNLIDKSRLRGVPRHGIGRGFKVGKEEIVGLLEALRLFVAADHDTELKLQEERLGRLLGLLKDAKSTRAQYLPPSQARVSPLTEIRFLDAISLPDMVRIVEKLRGARPPVYLDESRLEIVLQVNPFNLRQEDLSVIANRIREAVQTSGHHQ